MASSGSFYQLPDELLVKIFSYLDIPELVLNIQHVDSRWKAIVQDISFWRDYVFTFEKQMADRDIIMLLKNMPALRAVVATRPVPNKVIQTLFQSNKYITCLELHHNQKFTVSHLETIVKTLPQIQHLAFPLSGTGSENEIKYSTLIQQLPELLSLRLLEYPLNVENCFFLKEIAECPLLHEIDLGEHLFLIEDIILFLKAKKQILSKFAALSRNSVEMMRHLESCKQLQTLCLSCSLETLPDMPMFDLPNLKHLAVTHYAEEDFSVIARNLRKSTTSNLVKLDLTSCCLDQVEFENILDKCVHLKILILRCCWFTDGDDFKFIRRCIHLEYLDVNNTPISDLAVEIFAKRCKNLKYLDISDCPWISDFSLLYLLKCRELQTLKMNITRITGENFHLIPRDLTKLRDLYVEECDDLQFKYVEQLEEQMPHLKVHRSIEVPEDFVDLAETNLFREI